jgi:Na+/proline symporter
VFSAVVIYTAVGGLKATFLTDFLHTTVALILLIYFSLAVLTNEHIGGVYGLYDKVMAAEVHIEGNYAGSLLSAKSRGGMSGPAYDYANKNCVHILTLIGSYLVRSRAQIWQSCFSR